MAMYRVSFFNDLVNCYGMPAKVCQRIVEIRQARDAGRALEAAKRRFARAEDVASWDLRARSFEVQLMSGPPPAARSRRRH